MTSHLLAGLLAAGMAGWGPPSPPTDPATGLQAPQRCAACHRQMVATFTQTAHFRTSAEATAATVHARFSPGHNVLRTRVPGIYFVMERRADGFYETSVDSGAGDRRTARIDLVVGSGRRGQTYLYWSNRQLFELPVSYLTGLGVWINSPGYEDGQIDFARPIVPRCLECHSTSFSLVNDRGMPRYSPNYVLGITCEKCHGDGRAHIAYHASHPGDTTGKRIVNPARLATARQVDLCALCHSGVRVARLPIFSYRPGEALENYFFPPLPEDSVPDVHGNQVGLLQRSKCFRASPGMSCATCHDVHQPQRDVGWFAQKCLGCHDTTTHPMRDQIGDRMVPDCVDCHMPNRASQAIQINTRTRQLPLRFRSHRIGVYPDLAAVLLRAPEGGQRR